MKIFYYKNVELYGITLGYYPSANFMKFNLLTSFYKAMTNISHSHIIIIMYIHDSNYRSCVLLAMVMAITICRNY